MKATILLTDFGKAVKAVSPACSKEDIRPSLKYIHITCDKKEAQFFSCNGFMALRCTVPCDCDEPFDAWMLPVKVKVKSASGYVTLEKISNTTRITIPAYYGAYLDRGALKLRSAQIED